MFGEGSVDLGNWTILSPNKMNLIVESHFPQSGGATLAPENQTNHERLGLTLDCTITTLLITAGKL